MDKALPVGQPSLKGMSCNPFDNLARELQCQTAKARGKLLRKPPHPELSCGPWTSFLSLPTFVSRGCQKSI